MTRLDAALLIVVCAVFGYWLYGWPTVPWFLAIAGILIARELVKRR